MVDAENGRPIVVLSELSACLAKSEKNIDTGTLGLIISKEQKDAFEISMLCQKLQMLGVL